MTLVSYLTTAELAERWKLSPRTLERWRTIGWGSCFLKVGGHVIYRLSDIEDYEHQHMRVSTSQAVHTPKMGGVV